MNRYFLVWLYSIQSHLLTLLLFDICFYLKYFGFQELYLKFQLKYFRHLLKGLDLPKLFLIFLDILQLFIYS